MAELTVPSIDFSPLGELGKVYRQANDEQAVKQTFSQLGQGGKIDPTTLIRSGSLPLAQLGFQVQQRDAESAWRREEAQRAEKHFQMTYALQKSANDRAGEDKFGIKEVTDPNTGVTTFVKFNPRTGDVAPASGYVPQVSAPNNPFSSGGKFNGDQGKAAGFTDRMLQSEGILSGVDGGGGVQGQGTNITQQGLSKIPVFGNYLVSGDQQKYSQAKADFINAQLRRESGAAIGASEFANADKQYFPVPGDSPDVIKQKAANRRAAVEAMGREGGSSYRPKSTYTSDGRLVTLPKIGEMKEGYRFKGGDPADQSSWVKVSN